MSQPRQLLFTHQLMQQVNGLELILNHIIDKDRRFQPGLFQHAAHGANAGAFDLGKLQVIQHVGKYGIAQNGAGFAQLFNGLE